LESQSEKNNKERRENLDKRFLRVRIFTDKILSHKSKEKRN